MKDTKWPYVAGILDGEGSICLYHIKSKQGYQHSGLQVVIYGTSLNLMKYLIANFGGKYYTRSKTHLSKKVQYVWHPSGRKNREKFLLGALPYMVIKREQAKLALEYIRIGDQIKDPECKAELIAQCQSLNKLEPATTNTLDDSDDSELMIESDLIGDYESALGVIQGSANEADLA